MKKLRLLSCLIILCLTFTGCKSTGKDTLQTNTPIPTNTTIAPDEEESTLPGKTPNDADTLDPSNTTDTNDTNDTNKADDTSVDSDETKEDNLLLTSLDAQALIEEKIDLKKYAVTLLDDSLTIDDATYFQFVVSEQATAIEPTLIVDSFSGTISCLSSDGTIQDYSAFPLYNPLTDAVCDWNGVFKRYTLGEDSDATIILYQGDRSSFEFTLDAVNAAGNIGNLTGIARISGNTATFTDDEGFILSFLRTEEGLILSESGPNGYAGANVTFDGDYKFETLTSMDEKINIDTAINLLKTLPPNTLDLPTSLTEYTLLSDDQTINMKDTICYTISAYSDLGDHMSLMNTYYVAIDGSKIYRFDPIAADDIIIYEAQQ